jgi:type I restriction enzyme S subunit
VEGGLDLTTFGYVDISSIDNSSFTITEVRMLRGKEAPSRARRPVKPNDTLFSNVRTYLRNIALVPKALQAEVCSTGFTVLRPNSAVDPRYLFRYVLTDAFIDSVTPLQTGTHYPATSDRVVMSQRLPLAPLGEQRRVVAALEALLPKVETSRQRMDNISIILKHFRQSVIAAACSGRLTADWRADDSYENDLPTGWEWIPLKELLPPGGIFDGPFGSNLKSSDYTESGTRVIRLENIGHLRFIGEKETFVSERKYQTLRKHTVGEGDIIFSSFIAEEIRACVLPKLSTKAIAKADCFCLRPNAELVDGKYLVFQLVSQKSYNALFEEIHGATRPRVNTTQLRELEVRTCSVPEQREIVRRVDALLKIADRVEARYQEVKSRVDSLTQSILTKAFRGELVPQDPNDEPAEKLLERMRKREQSSKKKTVV